MKKVLILITVILIGHCLYGFDFMKRENMKELLDQIDKTKMEEIKQKYPLAFEVRDSIKTIQKKLNKTSGNEFRNKVEEYMKQYTTKRLNKAAMEITFMNLEFPKTYTLLNYAIESPPNFSNCLNVLGIWKLDKKFFGYKYKSMPIIGEVKKIETVKVLESSSDKGKRYEDKIKVTFKVQRYLGIQIKPTEDEDVLNVFYDIRSFDSEKANEISVGDSILVFKFLNQSMNVLSDGTFAFYNHERLPIKINNGKVNQTQLLGISRDLNKAITHQGISIKTIDDLEIFFKDIYNELEGEK